MVHQDQIKAGFMPLRVVADGVYLLSHNAEGTCHYFQDSLCQLHKQHGLELKPSICRIYPFNIVNTPDGYFLSLLYSCPAVLAGVGDPVSRQAQDLQAILNQNDLPLLPDIQEHVLVTQYHSVSWTQYLQLEGQLLEKMTVDDPVTYLLNAACLLANPREEFPDFDLESPLTMESVGETLPELATTVLAHLESHVDEDALDSFLEALREGDRPHSQRLETTLPPFEVLKPASHIERDAINRYLRNQIHGKLLLVGPSLVSRLILSACALSILLYDLRVLAQRDGVLHFNFEHLQQAFDVCEERLVAQSADLEPMVLHFEELLLELVE